VIERLAPLTRGRDRDTKIFAHAILPDVVIERPRPKPGFVLDVLVRTRAVNHTVIQGYTLPAPASRYPLPATRFPLGASR